MCKCQHCGDSELAIQGGHGVHVLDVVTPDPVKQNWECTFPDQIPRKTFRVRFAAGSMRRRWRAARGGRCLFFTHQRFHIGTPRSSTRSSPELADPVRVHCLRSGLSSLPKPTALPGVAQADSSSVPEWEQSVRSKGHNRLLGLFYMIIGNGNAVLRGSPGPTTPLNSLCTGAG